MNMYGSYFVFYVQYLHQHMPYLIIIKMDNLV